MPLSNGFADSALPFPPLTASLLVVKSTEVPRGIVKINIQPLTSDLLPAVERFNTRIKLFDIPGRITPEANPETSPELIDPSIVERFVILDETDEIRGGYSLRRQELWHKGVRHSAAHIGMPVSEGVADKRFALMGMLLMRDALQRAPLSYTLGAGGIEGQVFKILRPLGWKAVDVPFFFRILNASRFTRLLPQIRRSKVRSAIGSLLGYSGVSALLLHGLQCGAALRSGVSCPLNGAGDFLEIPDLQEVADELWRKYSHEYQFSLLRDSRHCAAAFPADRSELRRLVVRRNGEPVGWAVVMTRGLSRITKFLGELKVGLIVDCFGSIADSPAIVNAATAALKAEKVDVILTNQSHAGWVGAFRSKGYLTYQSQYPLMVSKAVSKQVGDLESVLPHSHWTRADGDGVHYIRD